MGAFVLDVSKLGFGERLAAASIQGLANRRGPRVYLRYGFYDDPASRRTNESFMPDEIWESTFRPMMGDQDEANLAYYREACGMSFEELPGLDALARRFRSILRGFVVYDPELPETIDAAACLAGLEDLVIVPPALAAWASGLGLEPRRDLRGRWKDRLELFAWAAEGLYPRCAPGKLACLEPGWERPEFVDYLVRERIFAYSLAHRGRGPLGAAGKALALFLVGGPRRLRGLAFGLGLDGPIRRLARRLMEASSPECSLAGRLQRRAARDRELPLGAFPTIYGWHTRRDDELDFLLALSANGLRLLPAHLAADYSFHAAVPYEGSLAQDHAEPDSIRVEKKIYLSFTLSDGDQLLLMHSGQLGNWRSPARGSVPFTWEIQPLLAELAPALLARYFREKRPADYLIAGPSGAGYLIPPLCPELRRYLAAGRGSCARAGVRAGTSYIGDPPRRVLRELAAEPGPWLGWLMGYANLGSSPREAPAYRMGGMALVANALPLVSHIWDDGPATLEAVRRAIADIETLPAFLGVHLFAYKTTIAQVSAFAATLDPERVKVVRADELLLAAAKGRGE